MHNISFFRYIRAILSYIVTYYTLPNSIGFLNEINNESYQ